MIFRGIRKTVFKNQNGGKKMYLKERNICIATKCFAALILDYEWESEDGFPSCVSCRVLIEDVFQRRIITETREQAIEQFMTGAWRRSGAVA